MTDKTQLEIDLERKERGKKPGSAFILIVFFSVSLVVLGIYTIKLKQELLTKDEEITLIKRNCSAGRIDPANKLKNLAEQEHGQPTSNSGSSVDTANVKSSTGN